MVSPFEAVVQRLWDLGFFTYILPYILTVAIFYGLLRKSQIFGAPEKNVAVNASVALVASLFVWASPVLLGIDPGKLLPLFFLQASIGILVIAVSIMVVSMFFPNIQETLSKAFGGKSVAIFIIFGLIIGFAVFVSSGLVNVIFPAGIFVPADVMTAAIVIILIIIAIAVIGWMVK